MINKAESEIENDQEEAFLLTEVAMSDVCPIGLINWRGMWTLIIKEVSRFLKVPIQTIASPLLMMVLFYAVFSVSMGAVALPIKDTPFLVFLVPGLVIMSMAQSAYVNTSSSMILSKIQGNMVDVLMPPLSPFELTVGYTIGGMMRGLVVGSVALGVMYGIRPFVFFDSLYVLYFAVMGSLMLSLIGLITGIWGEKFDHLMAIQNFIVMPATFLSGSFFSIYALPEKWQLACTLNPFFYMIDGFRYGFTGYADASVYTGIAYLLIINMVLFNIAFWMFGSSRKLRP